MTLNAAGPMKVGHMRGVHPPAGRSLLGLRSGPVLRPRFRSRCPVQLGLKVVRHGSNPAFQVDELFLLTSWVADLNPAHLAGPEA